MKDSEEKKVELQPKSPAQSPKPLQEEKQKGGPMRFGSKNINQVRKEPIKVSSNVSKESVKSKRSIKKDSKPLDSQRSNRKRMSYKVEDGAAAMPSNRSNVQKGHQAADDDAGNDGFNSKEQVKSGYACCGE